MLQPLRNWLLLFVAFAAVAAYVLAVSPSPAYLLIAEYTLLLPALLLAPRRPGTSLEAADRGVRGTLAVCFVLLLGVGLFITRGFAGGDEAAYAFQARVFGAGKLAAPAPEDRVVDGRPLREAFRFHHHVIRGDQWYGKYPFGWPALLSGGQKLGVAWLVNPLLALLYLALLYRVGVLVYGRVVAALAAAALAVSPAFVHQSNGFLSHTSCGGTLSTLIRLQMLLLLRGV